MTKLLALASTITLSLTACALDADVATGVAPLTAKVCPAGTPSTIAPDADQDLAFTMHAEGVQIYECRAGANGAAWVLQAPDAVLYDRDGVEVGSHYGGPTWEHEDGSLVVAARRSGAAIDPTSVAWLLLDVTDDGEVDGRMSEVTSIQRLSTTGGLAPATGCDADHLGATTEVPYTAEYFFYRTRAQAPEKNLRCGAE